MKKFRRQMKTVLSAVSIVVICLCVAVKLLVVNAQEMLGSALIVVVIFGWLKSRTEKHEGQAANLQGRRARNRAPDIGRLCCGIC